MDVDCKSLLPSQQTTIKWRHCPEKELGTVTPGIQWVIFLMHLDMLDRFPTPFFFQGCRCWYLRALSSDPAPLWLMAFMF